jgi:hypothetical protein
MNGMKNQRYFSGIILIGFGAFFLFQHSDIAFLQQLAGWQSVLMIVGVAFLWEGYGGHQHEMIFPGVIIFGFGLHFYVITYLQIWQDHIGIFILIIALAYILKYQKTGVGLFQGILFLIFAAFLLFQDRVSLWLGTLESRMAIVWEFWPLLLIGFGIYFLMKRKR